MRERRPTLVAPPEDHNLIANENEVEEQPPVVWWRSKRNKNQWEPFPLHAQLQLEEAYQAPFIDEFKKVTIEVDGKDTEFTLYRCELYFVFCTDVSNALNLAK